MTLIIPIAKEQRTDLVCYLWTNTREIELMVPTEDGPCMYRHIVEQNLFRLVVHLIHCLSF